MKRTKSPRLASLSQPDTQGTCSASSTLPQPLLETAMTVLNATSMLVLLWFTALATTQSLTPGAHSSDRLCNSTVSDRLLDHEQNKEKRHVQPD